jgi:hypothetical protein
MAQSASRPAPKIEIERDFSPRRLTAREWRIENAESDMLSIMTELQRPRRYRTYIPSRYRTYVPSWRLVLCSTGHHKQRESSGEIIKIDTIFGSFTLGHYTDIVTLPLPLSQNMQQPNDSVALFFLR